MHPEFHSPRQHSAFIHLQCVVVFMHLPKGVHRAAGVLVLFKNGIISGSVGDDDLQLALPLHLYRSL